MSRSSQAITCILALAAVLVAIYFGIRADKNKSLRIECVAERRLVTQDAPRGEGFAVVYQGETISDPWLLTLRISNDGELPIVATDIEEPLTIIVENATLLRCEVTTQEPGNLSVTAEVSAQSVVVRHGLLNPRDGFSLDVLADGKPGVPIATSRISGIAEPTVVTVPLADSIHQTPFIALFPTFRTPILLATSVAAFIFATIPIVLVAQFVVTLRKPPTDIEATCKRALDEAGMAIDAKDKDRVARTIYRCLPNGLDERARTQICKINHKSLTKDDFRRTVQEILLDFPKELSTFSGRLKAADTSLLWVGLMMMVFAGPIVVVVVSAWQQF